MASFIIQLNSLRFFAKHGIYDEERSTGNEFEVNISLSVKAPKEKITSLEQTINYAEVYRITKERFFISTPLLETLATELVSAIKDAFPSVKKISVQIIKINPPIVAFTGSVSVTYQKRFT
ncbi:MAG TPA: dihydroneopterin aldolase [Flavisolibacter sp.]|nr:dihydroneopterin aldolase [Flavisolibacter sp.]